MLHNEINRLKRDKKFLTLLYDVNDTSQRDIQVKTDRELSNATLHLKTAQNTTSTSSNKVKKTHQALPTLSALASYFDDDAVVEVTCP